MIFDPFSRRRFWLSHVQFRRVSLGLVDSVKISNREDVWFVSFFVDVLLQNRPCNPHKGSVSFIFLFPWIEFLRLLSKILFRWWDLTLYISDRWGQSWFEVATNGLWRRWWTELQRQVIIGGCQVGEVSSDNCGFGFGCRIRWLNLPNHHWPSAKVHLQRSLLYSVLFCDVLKYRFESWFWSLSKLWFWSKTGDWLNLHCLNVFQVSWLCLNFEVKSVLWLN